MQIEVEQRDLGLRGFGQQHRETYGDARCSGAALGAADRDHMPTSIDRTWRRFGNQPPAQLGLHDIARERLRKVFAQAEVHESAVECDILVVSNQSDPNIGRADARQPFKFREWIVLFADVRHQREQLGIGFEHADGVAYRAALDLDIAALEAFQQSLRAQIVVDETDNSVANDGRQRRPRAVQWMRH